MKRFASLALAVCMLIGMCFPATAAVIIPDGMFSSNYFTSYGCVINDDGGVSYSGPRFIHIKLAGISSWSMKVFKIPEPSSNYANRVLTVDSDGAPQWVAPATMTGASAQSAGSSGLVPAPASGDDDKFLKGDGTWGEAASAARITYDAVNEELHIDFSNGSV